MNQLVAFFAPTALPNAAGAVVRATSAEQGESFAGLLAQLQAAASPDANIDPSAQTSQLLAQLPTAVPQGAGNLSTEDVAAKLQALAGTTTGGVATEIGNPGALLDTASFTAAPQPPTPQADADLAPVALVAAQLQSQVQPVLPTDDASQATPATPPPATPADLGVTTPTDLGLRGTLAAEQNAATSLALTFNQNASATAVAHAAPAAMAAAGQQPKAEPNPPNANLIAAERRATPGAPSGAPAAPNAAPTPGTNTTAEAPTSQAAAPQSQGQSQASPQGATHAPANPADSTPNQPAFAPTAPAQVTLADAPQVTATAIATPQVAVPLDALAVNIARKFEAGISQFEIRLHPAELGQLNISLTVAEDGRVQAVLRAERPETLDILQRDARALEQQLRQAGLEVGSNSLSFSLSSGNGQRQPPFAGWPAFADAQDAAELAKKEAASTYIAVRQRDGVDIRV